MDEQSTMPASDQPGGYSLRRAELSDVSGVTELVDAAYRHYVERIGMLPGPMTDDYKAVIRNYHVTVAEHAGSIVGVIVLRTTDEGFLIDNVAVHPSDHGRGLGRRCFISPRPRHGVPASTRCTCTRTRR